ncbi:MAG: DUF502 domain-containing protein [Phycisphaerae bacterium]|nr:DUF502 domain-containing protein [Phycisphaerae bacterium]
MDDFKRFFLRGLAALLPTLLTIAVLFWAYEFVDKHIGQHVNRGIILGLSYLGPPTIVNEDTDPLRYGTPVPEWLSDGRQITREHKLIHHIALRSPDEKVAREAARRRDRALWEVAFAKYKLHAIGFVIAIILVYFLGYFLASFIGRTTWRIVEGLILRLPLVRTIYPNIKQVTDFLFTDRQFEFSGVVAVQYPRHGVWSLGLLTGSPMKHIQDRETREMLTVFIPSSPTPVTGYTITVAKEDVVLLDVSIDDALRFTISGGVIKPGTAMSGAPHSAALPGAQRKG